jgi:hypothetical protein
MLQSCKTGITAQKEPAGNNTGVIRENILLEIHNTQSIIHCCSSQLRSEASAATITTTATVFTKNTHQDTSQTSGQSVHSKNVNSNAMDMFLAFTMVQQIMTELSGTVKR